MQQFVTKVEIQNNLRVEEGTIALLYRREKFVRLLQPGTYKKKILNLTKGRGPFTAQIIKHQSFVEPISVDIPAARSGRFGRTNAQLKMVVALKFRELEAKDLRELARNNPQFLVKLIQAWLETAMKDINVHSLMLDGKDETLRSLIRHRLEETKGGAAQFFTVTSISELTLEDPVVIEEINNTVVLVKERGNEKLELERNRRLNLLATDLGIDPTSLINLDAVRELSLDKRQRAAALMEGLPNLVAISDLLGWDIQVALNSVLPGPANVRPPANVLGVGAPQGTAPLRLNQDSRIGVKGILGSVLDRQNRLLLLVVRAENRENAVRYVNLKYSGYMCGIATISNTPEGIFKSMADYLNVSQGLEFNKSDGKMKVQLPDPRNEIPGLKMKALESICELFAEPAVSVHPKP
jgi:hypothetical protein